jgi:hypothetical protein
MTVPLIAWNSEQRAYELQLVDPATGNTLPDRLPIGLTESTSFAPTLALSPNGSRLAVITGVGSACEASGIGHACWRSAELLRLIELQSGREVTAEIPGNPPAKGWVGPLVFSRDGGRFAIAYHDRIGTTAVLFNAETGQLIGQQALTIRPRLMEFTADGAWLVIYGSPLADLPGFTQPGPPSALLLDGASLELKWSVVLPDILDGDWCYEDCSIDRVSNSESGRFVSWTPALAFDAVMGRLHIVHADQDRLTTVDFLERRAGDQAITRGPTWIERLLALTAEVAEAKYWPEGASKSAVLSPDGAHLYVVGNKFLLSKNADGDWEGSAQPLGLTVIAIRSGRELIKRESDARRIRLSADSRLLILDWEVDSSIQVLDAESLEPVGGVEMCCWDVVTSRRLDGQAVLLAIHTSERPYTTYSAMLAPETFELLEPWSVPGMAFWVTAP